MTFRHRAGVRPYTSPCGLAESCVFGKQSLGPFHCGPPALGRLAPSRRGAPLLPRLRGHYAEFLDRGSPDRLGILYPPTCVGLGTGGWVLPRGFSRKHGLTGFAKKASSRVSGFLRWRISLPRALRAFTRTSRTAPGYPSPSPHRSVAPPAGTGMSARCASATPAGLALAPDSPWED